jgi:hypothetical protein
MAVNGALDASALSFTRDDLKAFEAEVPKSKDSAALIEAMTRRTPDAGLAMALQIGAKVVKGEMAWD